MQFELLPYAILLGAVLATLIGQRPVALCALGLAMITALMTGRMTLIALPAIAVLALSLWLPDRLALRGAWRWISFTISLVLATLFSVHRVPGFDNLLIYDRVQFAADSLPFTMYLNFDKTLVGVFLCLFFIQPREPRSPALQVVTAHAGLLILVLLGLALGTGYVHYDPKWPTSGWIWCLNNFFFVCLAEEALFRGFIQGGLQRLLPKTRLGSWIAIFVAAVLFGLLHLAGGWSYVALATVAGVFYGHAYLKTGRLSSAMLVHFTLNLVHFALFSYPAALRS